MKGRASRAVYMRLQPSLLSPPSDPEEREKKKGAKNKNKGAKKTAPVSWVTCETGKSDDAGGFVHKGSATSSRSSLEG